MSDFERAMAEVRKYFQNWRGDRLLRMYLPKIDAITNAMAAAHADVVQERDHYKRAAQSLAHTLYFDMLNADTLGDIDNEEEVLAYHLTETEEASHDHATSTG